MPTVFSTEQATTSFAYISAVTATDRSIRSVPHISTSINAITATPQDTDFATIQNPNFPTYEVSQCATWAKAQQATELATC